MASLITSFFSSTSSQLANRIEAMRSAEASLMDLSRRFITGENHNQTMEIVDTKIPRSSVPLKDDGKPGCQVFDDGESDDYILHGVKVVNHDRTGSDAPPLVLLHGYANGALYFYRNLLGLSKAHYSTTYALDMLGWGLSSRPEFRTTPDDETVESAEEVFVESLEAWRKANNIDRMTLGGHSMGGYLSVAYSEKYPERVERLILLSPVGVPHRKDDPAKRSHLPLRYQFMIGLATTLWNRGTTPGAFLRTLPESRAKGMVEGYVERRLPAIKCPNERAVLSDYLFTNAMLPGSGEYCLNRILSPMAFAKKPAVHRIPSLKVKSVHFVYGQDDWMDASGGLEVQKICDDRRRDGEDAPDVEVHGVKDAGHLLMLDNWEEFNSAVVIAGGGGHKLPADAPRPDTFRHTDQHTEKFFSREFGRGVQRSKAEQ